MRSQKVDLSASFIQSMLHVHYIVQKVASPDSGYLHTSQADFARLSDPEEQILRQKLVPPLPFQHPADFTV